MPYLTSLNNLLYDACINFFFKNMLITLNTHPHTPHAHPNSPHTPHTYPSPHTPPHTHSVCNFSEVYPQCVRGSWKDNIIVSRSNIIFKEHKEKQKKQAIFMLKKFNQQYIVQAYQYTKLQFCLSESFRNFHVCSYKFICIVRQNNKIGLSDILMLLGPSLCLDPIVLIQHIGSKSIYKMKQLRKNSTS